jgi:hypothetical protein
VVKNHQKNKEAIKLSPSEMQKFDEANQSLETNDWLRWEDVSFCMDLNQYFTLLSKEYDWTIKSFDNAGP